MKSENYQVEDFLQDESFFNWLKKNNKEDIAQWEAWWRDNPDHRSKAREAINLINSISFKDRGFNEQEINALWSRIKDQNLESQREPVKRKEANERFIYRYLGRVAAVALPLVAGFAFYLYYQNASLEPADFAQQQMVREIPKGQKLTVFLPDGSMVKLNSESRITYSEPFDEKERVVTLDGEAFFEVTPDANRPFKVVTRGLETRVLGTSFNVNAYPEEAQIQVAVVTGKVSVEQIDQAETDTKTIVLSPSEQATYSVETNQTVVSGYNPSKVIGWKNGTLYFNNASMEDFVEELERWYGIDIEVQRQVPIKKGIVGEFTNQSLEEILMGMHVASEFEYEFKNGKLIIK